jgi:hypothetical protein
LQWAGVNKVALKKSLGDLRFIGKCLLMSVGHKQYKLSLRFFIPTAFEI